MLLKHLSPAARMHISNDLVGRIESGGRPHAARGPQFAQPRPISSNQMLYLKLN